MTELFFDSSLVYEFGSIQVFLRTDPAGNIKADKAKSTEKIDGAVGIYSTTPGNSPSYM